MAKVPGGERHEPEAGGADTTSPSLLIRIRDASDRQAWQEFVELYAPLIYGLARRRGLQDADAADVTQEVFRAVAKRLSARSIRGAKDTPDAASREESSESLSPWEYDPERGSFRSWLYTVTRHKISDFLSSSRGLRPRLQGSGDTANQIFLEQHPEAAEDESQWQQDYQQRVFAWAAQRIRNDFQEKTWDAFWQLAVEGKSGEETARSLHMTVGAVYVAKSRVLARLKKEIEQLNRTEE
jgi:RNA polymerase sigma-70 factor (ECF subfamily)